MSRRGGFVVEPTPWEVSSPPRPQLELPGVHRLLHIDTRFREPLQMLFAFLGIHNVGSLFATVEAIFDDRVKHSALLVDAVEESANMTVPAEVASGALYGMIDSHISPHSRSKHTHGDLTPGSTGI